MTVRTNLGRRGGWASAAKLAPLALLASCAWSNPANRPVWNAFEQHLVAEDDGWFYVSLPLTVPVGLGAIVVDTVVAHPIQVLDDAVRDAGELWDTASMNFAEAYYTEMAWLPFRAVLTPVAFVGSWAGRSVFDIPRHEPAPSEAELLAAQQRARQE
ncbi:MAG: hypothetical protein KAI24_21975, partial [Planctomycetes bacterium]|nr:hypothetical protein [Planctomycetota bacterium]